MMGHEIAEIAGINVTVVRYYSRIGLLQPTRNPINGYREYTRQDLHRIRFIQKAKWLGLKLRDVKTILCKADSGKSPCEDVRKMVASKLEENQQQLNHLQTIQKRMKRALVSWCFISGSSLGKDHFCT